MPHALTTFRRTTARARADRAAPPTTIKARAYGLPGVRVDGNDLLAVHAAVKDAVGRARAGAGPTIVELLTYRMGGHSSSDDPRRYRPDSWIEECVKHDPCLRMRRYLEAKGLWDIDSLDERLH